MDTEDQCPDSDAMPTTRYFGKNLIGAFSILIISLLMIRFILASDIIRYFNTAILVSDAQGWFAILGPLLILGILIGFPVFLIIQGLIAYQSERHLEKIGELPTQISQIKLGS